MNEGCFDIVSYYEIDIPELRDKLIEKKVFSIKKPISKTKFDDYYSFIVSLLKA